MGGLILLVAVIPLSAIVIAFAAAPAWQNILVIWVVGTAATAILGLSDDRHSLTARCRLLISLATFALAAAIEPAFNIRLLSFEIAPFELGLGTGWLAVIFTVICGVGLINAVNMADGKNGLVIGLCIGWIFILSFRAPSALMPIIALLLIALTIMLAFNLVGRLFLGDGGSYGFSCAIALLAIAIFNMPGDHAGRAISADEVMLLFAVPVLDSFRLTFVRMRRGQSPMTADRDHLHHHLENWLGWPQGLIAYLCIALVPAAMVII
ncbi:MAG: MraY family glycosyltransferase [Sphingorhabdus sp.]